MSDKSEGRADSVPSPESFSGAELPSPGEPNNWGRWGADDEHGAQNLVDSAKVLAALALAREGRIISLAQPIGPKSGVAPHRNRMSRFMDRDAGDYALGARAPGGFKFAEDTVMMSAHSGTHMDALAHAWSGDHLYNGHSSAATRSTMGAQKLGADKLLPTITRGILVDLVTASGGPLAPSAPIDSADIIASYARSGIEPLPGDAVLLRTGWWTSTGGTPAHFDLEPGLSDDGASWLADQDVSLVGADNYAVEVQPDPAGATFPVHLRLIHRHGIPLIENLDLEELAASGAKTFMLMLAPLPLQGSTGSPVTPLAVL